MATKFLVTDVFLENYRNTHKNFEKDDLMLVENNEQEPELVSSKIGPFSRDYPNDFSFSNRVFKLSFFRTCFKGLLKELMSNIAVLASEFNRILTFF